MRSPVAKAKLSPQAPSADETLQHCVEQALTATGYPGLQTLNVRVHEGLVSLGGTAPNYHLKQLAQTVAMRTPGVELLRNDIQVVTTDRRTRQ